MRPLLLPLLVLSACTSTIPVEYDAVIYGEAFIEEGIPADEFVDGWAVTFETFLVSVGEVSLDGAPLSDEATTFRIFDLAQASGGDGFSVGRGEHALAGPDVGYIIGPGSAAVAGNATSSDVDLMNDAGWSVYVVGQATRGGETRDFAWGFATRTVYTACEIGGATDIELTIHGDHLFYDDLISDSPNLAFDLIASAGDGSGPIGEPELRAIDITTQERYQVGDLTQITNLWDFIEQQTATLGHINGEGHCEAARTD